MCKIMLKKIILTVVFLTICFNFMYTPSVSAKKIKKRTSASSIKLNKTPGIKSAAALAITLDDNQVLFSKNAFTQRSIASLTKLMSVLVLEDLKLDWNAIYTIPYHVFKPYYKTRLKPGLQFTAIDLLHSALLGSDNVAVLCLVEVSGLPEQHFVQLMNNYAQRLNLQFTKFSDPTGIEESNVSTSYEISVIMRKVLENPFLSKIVKTKYMTIRALNSYYSIDYVNTNRLLLDPRKKTLGGKTGFISEAGYCLVTTNRLDCGKDVIMVFLGANGKLTRFADANRMYDWLNKKNLYLNPEYSAVKTENKIYKDNPYNYSDTNSFRNN